jgi:hypothetical protein
MGTLCSLEIEALYGSKEKRNAPNTACSGRLGLCAFSSIFLALSFFRFDGESQLTHQPLT